MQSRLERFVSLLPEDVDGALITSAVGRAYLTGMHSSAGTILAPRDGKACFLIDFRYIEKARNTVAGCEVILQDKLYEQLNELIDRYEIKRLGIESPYLPVGDYLTFSKNIKAELVMDEKTGDVLSKMRMIKDTEEVEAIRQAQKITDQAFTYILNEIRPGRTEREIARELRDFTDRKGSEGPSFDYIVVSGKNSSMPHGVPSDKAIETGDFVTMDFGCVCQGYCSDMTRTVAVGHCTDEMMQVYDTVLQAQKTAIAAVRPGIACKDADAAARSIIDARYPGCFGHGTGHSLGLEIHESPAFNTRDETLCAPGMVITVEPGIYLENKFGVRIEDMVLITAAGCLDLTNSEKSLIVL